MPTLAERWGQRRLIAIVPPSPADASYTVAALIAPVEVMAQEGIALVSLPASSLDADPALIHQLNGIFASRVQFGCHGVGSAEQVGRVADAGAGFALLNILTPHELDNALNQGRDRDLPLLPAALTPTEVSAAWALGVAAVQVVPADAFGSGYPEQVRQLVAQAVMVPRGGLGAHSAGRWLEAGALGVCLDEALVGDAFTGGSLVAFRERCQVFSEVGARYQ